MEPPDNQGQHDKQDKETPSPKTGFIDRINAFFKRNPTSTISVFVVIFLLLTAITVTIDNVQTRQETQSMAQNNLFPTSRGCAGSGIGEGCPPTPTVQGGYIDNPSRGLENPRQINPSHLSSTITQPTPTLDPSSTETLSSSQPPATNNSARQDTNNKDIWTRIVQALQDLIAAIGRLLNMSPTTTPPAQPTPIVQPPTQASQPLPSASPANPQVSQPAATSSPQPNSYGQKVGNGVAEAVLSQGEAIVFVALKQTTSREEIAKMQEQVLSQLDSTEFRIGHRYITVPGFSGTVLSQSGLEKLANHPNVVKIELDTGGSIN